MHDLDLRAYGLERLRDAAQVADSSIDDCDGGHARARKNHALLGCDTTRSAVIGSANEPLVDFRAIGKTV
jgi:hypothetical protein